MKEFQPLDVSHGPVAIRVRINWFVIPGLGAVRTRDGELWEHARQCHRCHVLGYEPGAIDAVLEAQRLGVEHAPSIADCALCGRPTCELCASLPCVAEGPAT